MSAAATAQRKQDPYAAFLDPHEALDVFTKPWRQLAGPTTLRVLTAAAQALAVAARRDARVYGDDPFDRGSARVDRGVLELLPALCDGRDGRFRRRIAQCFADLAGDLAAGRVPVGRCQAEDLAVHLMLEQAQLMHARALTDPPYRRALGWSPAGLRATSRFGWDEIRYALLGESPALSAWEAHRLPDADGVTGRAMDEWFDPYWHLRPRPTGKAPAWLEGADPDAEPYRVLAAPECDPWGGYTVEERRDRLREPLSALLSPAAARVWAAVGQEMADLCYGEAVECGDEPYVPLAPPDEDPEDLVLPRLPRAVDRQDQAWRVQAARAFSDLAAEVRGGGAPIPRCHMEDIALLVISARAAARVEGARWIAQGADAEELAQDWYGLPLGAYRHLPDSLFAFDHLDQEMTREAEAYLLWGDQSGFEHPDHPVNLQMSREDLRAEAWFAPFANTVQRPADRGFPEWVLQKLPASTRARLDAAAAPADGLGPVRARTPQVAALRQNVLNAIGADLHRQTGWYHAPAEDADPWQHTGRLVFSDLPEIALAQARRLQEQVGTGPVEISWAGSAGDEQAGWYRVRLVQVNDRSTGPHDEPWLRVGWQDGTLTGMAFADIVAVRAADQDTPLSRWQ